MSHKLIHICASLILVLAILGLVFYTQPVRAAGPWYVATTGDDSNDCLSPSTSCATINGAIGKASPGDMVKIAIGTYTGTESEVVYINKDITLSGGWNASFTIQSGLSTIDGNSSMRGVTVDGGSTSNIEMFDIINGVNSDGGAGILNSGILTVNNSAIRNNNATTGNSGGGIKNNGTFTLHLSTISDNTGNFGGGISNFGIAMLNQNTITGNSTWGGPGSGIYNSGTIVLTNSTITWNMQGTGNGGGIANQGSGTFLVNNSTIAYNQGLFTGGVISEGIQLTLQNSIVAKNSSSYYNAEADCSGSVNSSGFNLIGNISNCTFAITTGDQTNNDPLLGPLQDNGGFTFTHALLPGSPAIDTGNPAGCTDQDGNLLPADQRGVARPQGSRCDIGAFELESDGGAVEEVNIDIRPGSVLNPINRMSLGSTPVAILSTSDFDAPSMTDRTSLSFGRTGDELSLAFCNKGADVNNDGLLDLVCHFKTRLAGFQAGDTAGILKGMTFDGFAFEGQDVVTILR